MAVNDKSDPEMPGLLNFMEAYRRAYDFGTEAFSRARVEPLYKRDEDFTAYDLAPPARGYLGWSEYSDHWSGLLGKFSEFRYAYNDDLRVFRNGNTAWASVSGRTYGKSADGQPFSKDMRLTLVLVKENGRWLITHEHGSAPRMFELAGGVAV